MASAVLFHWQGDFKSFNISFGVFLAALLVAGMTAALDLWTSDLTVREKTDQTRSLSLGLGALANTFRFLLAGGATSVRRRNEMRSRSQHGHTEGA
jgi:hypothetical protein